MCLNSYFFINKQPFSNKLLILIFLQIFIFLKCFCLYLKMVKIANVRCGNERNSKTKYSTATKFAPVYNNDSNYKTMNSFFFFSKIMLHLYIMLRKLLIGRFPVTMAIAEKIRLHGFVRIVHT